MTTPISRIEGVAIHPLRQIPDERGQVMHMLRASDPWFHGFGEVYFSAIYPGVIKGWHLHKKMIINYAVPLGRIKLVLFDDREGSSSRGVVEEHYLGPDHYFLVQVPILVWNGFKGCGTAASLVANCASIVHDPDEIVRLDPFTKTIPYDWSLQHR